MNTSIAEHNFLEAITDQTISSINIDSTEVWKASWFLSSFTDVVWILKKHNSYLDNDTNEWKNVIRIYWNCNLYNGFTLGHKRYSDILNSVKTMVFLAREGFETFSGGENSQPATTRSQQQYDLSQSFKLTIRWMIINGHQPELTGFQSLTRSDYDDFICSLRYGSQLADGTYTAVDSLLQNAKTSKTLDKYLSSGRLNYSLIGKELNISSEAVDFKVIGKSGIKLRKYETAGLPEFIDTTYTKNKVEFLSTRAVKTVDVMDTPVSESALSGYLNGLKTIGQFASVLPELSGLNWCSENNHTAIARQYGFKPNKRTPTIPVSTALEYLDNALYWVIDLGPDLILLKRSCDIELLRLMKDNTSRKDYYAKNVLENVGDELANNLHQKGLSIKRYNLNPTNMSHVQIRDNLSVEDAINCLTAACFILIGTFTCKRISEVLSVTRNCSRPALDGGWELVFGLKKASPVEALSMIGRPIPDAVNSAIDLLRDLAPETIIHQGKNPEHDPLFLSNYRVNRTPTKAVELGVNTLYSYLELFSDVTNIKPDSNNQRWYVRSHELRRFFAISYFWHDRFSGLATLSWFMGHTDPEMTMHYVTEEISASEMPEEEARYSASIILEDKQDALPGVEKLTSLAEIHFGTRNLNMIEQHKLESYLEERFKEGYRIIKQGTKSKVIYLEEFSCED